jgi:hypothetical protein
MIPTSDSLLKDCMCMLVSPLSLLRDLTLRDKDLSRILKP